MSDDSIQIEYNTSLSALEKLLSHVKRSGDFYVHGTRETIMPKVEVEGVGALSFPVPAQHIAALIQHAKRAPYGRGPDTVLDESVRKVWQLPAEQVVLGGKSWPGTFDGLLQEVVNGLGCGGMKVTAELYKLLVYDTGGFFLAHRDTEKAGGMFGTLVVVLPSAHTGGELVIRQGDREVVVDMSRGESSELVFTAFYADCEHEVRPITSGNRVCLVYNLIQQRVAQGKSETLHAPDYSEEVRKAATILEESLSREGSSPKIAWLLEHHYSPEGLSFSGLKSADAARVKVLTEAARVAGCVAHLGIVHIEESGPAEYDGYHGGGYWDHDDEDDDGEGEENEDYEVVEVSDSLHFVNSWRDTEDRKIAYGDIPLAAGELLPADALKGEKPDKSKLLEASGNEGASFERSYHRAALVIWKRERHAEVLLQSGVAAALPYLQECVEKAMAPGAKLDLREQALAMVLRVVEKWKTTPIPTDSSSPDPAEKRILMLRLLDQMGDSAALETFLRDVIQRDYNGGENSALVSSAPRLGPLRFGTAFSALITAHLSVQHGACVELLQALACQPETSQTADWRDTLLHVSHEMIAQWDEVGKKEEFARWNWWLRQRVTPVNDALVSRLLNLLGAFEASDLRLKLADKIADRPAVFDPVTILSPALAQLHLWDGAAVKLWEHGAAFLLARSALPPEAPRDWRKPDVLSCPCDHCREMQAFLLNPNEQTHRFRIRMDRRKHLEEKIHAHSLEMTSVTDKTGTPQTLVCTKDHRRYDARCKQYRADIAALASLEELVGKESWPSPQTLSAIAQARTIAAVWGEV